MTSSPVFAEPGYLRRLALAARAGGWRLVVAVYPYALAAGIAAETAQRLPGQIAFRAALVALAILLLHVAIQVGAQVAATRRLWVAGLPAISALPQMRASLAIGVETVLALVIAALAGLSAVGVIDIAVLLFESTYAEDWPWVAARLAASFVGAAAAMILFAAALALALTIAGRRTGIAEAGARLVARSTEAGLTLALAFLGTAILAALAAPGLRAAGLSPMFAGMIGKSVGFVAGACLLAVAAVAVTDRPDEF